MQQTDRRFYNPGPRGKRLSKPPRLSIRHRLHAWAAIRALAKKVGGLEELAKVMQLSIVTVRQWRYRRVGLDVAIELERLCAKHDLAYYREDFRPDHWRKPRQLPIAIGGVSGQIDFYE